VRTAATTHTALQVCCQWDTHPAVVEAVLLLQRSGRHDLSVSAGSGVAGTHWGLDTRGLGRQTHLSVSFCAWLLQMLCVSGVYRVEGQHTAAVTAVLHAAPVQ
jgi:hypothetical protein